jgi:hypothetical protein
MKNPVKDHVPEIVEEKVKISAKETIAAVMGMKAPIPATPSVMDIFSPVNKSIV